MPSVDTTIADVISTQSSRCSMLSDTARPGAGKSAAVIKMLTRARGATISEVTTATGWKPHSVRAHLSGLRKKGIILVREARKSGEGAYRIESAILSALDAAPTTATDHVKVVEPAALPAADVAAV